MTVHELTARYDALFSQADAAYRDGQGAIDGELAAKGLYDSGVRIRRYIRLIEETTNAALAEALKSLDFVIQKDSLKRRPALAEELRRALDGHLERQVGAYITPALEKMGVNLKAADADLLKVRSRLDHEMNAFADGWTASPSKPWKDRHPQIWEIGILVLGALIGAIITKLMA